MTDRIVIFLHIPKAAGSTLNRVIAQNYPPAAILKAGGKSDAALLDEVTGEVRLIAGHRPFGMHAQLTRPFTYITVLRDPVERVLSQYHFVKRLAEHPLHRAVASGELSLRDYARQLPDVQTRYLAGSSTDDAALLEQAKTNLATHFAVAGLTERFDETLVLLQRALGWKVRPFANSNVSAGRPKSDGNSREDLDAIRECNQLDLALYDFAREHFERQIAEQGAGFHAAVAWLRLKNRAAGLLASKEAA